MKALFLVAALLLALAACGGGGSEDTPEDFGGGIFPFGSCLDTPSCFDLFTCSEALFYYHDCGQFFLDGDGDGVPCEILCGIR